MRYAVMEGSVSIAIRHVYDMLQQGWRDGSEGVQKVLYHLRHCCLLTGHTEPLMLHSVYIWPLEGFKRKA